MTNILKDFKYLWYVIVHPFDGFYEIRFRGKKNYIVATILLILYGLLNIISYQYTGFIMNNNPIFRMNSITLFLFALFPIALFIVSNWSITALFDGSGNMGDIYVVLCYSLLPKIIFDFAGVIISNFIISEEVSILVAFTSIGTVWFCFLVFCGLCVIHEYTPFSNVVVLISTFVAAVIIIFLITLYFSLMGRIINFVFTFISELSKRW